MTKLWKYSEATEKYPLHDIHLEAKAYHEAARELAKRLDDGDEPQEIRVLWLQNNNDEPRQFEVHAEVVVKYDAYEVKQK